MRASCTVTSYDQRGGAAAVDTHRLSARSVYTTLYSVRGLAGAGSPSTWVTGSSSAILVVFMPTWRPRCCVARCSSSAALLTHDAIATAANRQTALDLVV